LELPLLDLLPFGLVPRVRALAVVDVAAVVAVLPLFRETADAAGDRAVVPVVALALVPAVGLALVPVPFAFLTDDMIPLNRK